MASTSSRVVSREGGAEAFHSGMVPHSGTDTRTLAQRGRSRTRTAEVVVRCRCPHGRASRHPAGLEQLVGGDRRGHQLALKFDTTCWSGTGRSTRANIAVDFVNPEGGSRTLRPARRATPAPGVDDDHRAPRPLGARWRHPSGEAGSAATSTRTTGRTSGGYLAGLQRCWD